MSKNENTGIDRVYRNINGDNVASNGIIEIEFPDICLSGTNGWLECVTFYRDRYGKVEHISLKPDEYIKIDGVAPGFGFLRSFIADVHLKDGCILNENGWSPCKDETLTGRPANNTLLRAAGHFIVKLIDDKDGMVRSKILEYIDMIAGVLGGKVVMPEGTKIKSALAT